MQQATKSHPKVAHNKTGHPKVEHNETGHPKVVHNETGHPKVVHNETGHPKVAREPRHVEQQAARPVRSNVASYSGGMPPE